MHEILGQPMRRAHAWLALWCAGLWAVAFWFFSLETKSMYRFDGPGVEAYPMSDAANDFMNALAIHCGDGWVNWRWTARWSVYKPGWALFLAGLMWLADFDTGRMQWILTALLSLTVPMFFLLTRMVCRHAWRTGIALCATVLFLATPLDSWWFQRTMMTEGPTLLLLITATACLIRGVSISRWNCKWLFAAGVALGMAAMVRSQTQYCFLAALVVLVILAMRTPRRRLTGVMLFVAGYVAIVGPYYAKTSFHLKHPFFGTCNTSLIAVLEFSETGQAIGGADLPVQSGMTEWESQQFMKARVREAIGRNFSSNGGSVLTQGAEECAAWMAPFAVVPLKNKGFVTAGVLIIAVLAGIWHGSRRFGLAVSILFVMAVAYCLPHVAFSYYRDRFGAPLGWVGLFYAVMAVDGLSAQKRQHPVLRWFRWKRERAMSARSPRSRARWRALAAPGATMAGASVWSLAAGAMLVWFDNRPSWEDEFAADTAARIRQSISETTIGSPYVNNAVAVRALLPFQVEPGVAPFEYVAGPVTPLQQRGSCFVTVTPWKSGGFTVKQVIVPAVSWERIRHGELMIVRRDATGDAVDAIDMPTARKLANRPIDSRNN